MVGENIPIEVRRFIQAAIPSVPYLEAMLLLRVECDQHWGSTQLSQRLYISESDASRLLHQLFGAGVVSVVDEVLLSYQFHPRTVMLSEMIDRLDDVYSKQLVAVTQLIHSKIDKRAQQFADAFKLRKDS